MASGKINEPSKRVFNVQLGMGTSSDVKDLVDELIANMPSDGIYNFSGSWMQHSWGYDAICEANQYSASNRSYSGVITANDGNVWAFSFRSSQTSKNIVHISDGTDATATVPISRGGTGATTPNNACDNLETSKIVKVSTATSLPTSGATRLTFTGVLLGLLIFQGHTATRCGMYMIYGSSTTCTCTTMVEASAVTIEIGSGYLDIKTSMSGIYSFIITVSNPTRCQVSTVS